MIVPVFYPLLLAWFASPLIPAPLDLSIGQVSYQPQKPKVGEAVTFTYQITNLGPADAPKASYKVIFLVNGEMTGLDAEAGPLAAGMSHAYSKQKPYFHFKAKKKGRYPYEVRIEMAVGQADPNLRNNVVKGNLVVE